MNPKGRPQVSENTEKRIVNFFLRGWSYGRIARRVGTSTSTVWQVIHRQPTTSRRRHDPKLAERINRWRVGHGFTVRRVAQKLGVSPATVMLHAPAPARCRKAA